MTMERSPQVAPQNSGSEELLELARKAGAEAAEVYQSSSRSHPVYFEANRVKQLESVESSGMGLRLWKDGRPGVAVGEGPVNLQGLVDRAIALSALNEPEPVELTAGQSGLDSEAVEYPEVGTAMAVEPLMGMGRGAIAQVREKFPEVLCSGEWDCGAETTRLVNSLGLDCAYRDTTLSCFLAAEWVRGDDFLMVMDGQTDRDRLDEARVAGEVLRRLDWAQGTAVARSGRVPVLFTAKAASVLWGTVRSALNGKQLLEGSSPWAGAEELTGKACLSESRRGELVLSEKLTLFQDPLVGPFSCPFDDEGVGTQPLVFVENGILRNFYCDRTVGRQLGQTSTGNGFRRGLGSYPTPGLFNFVVQPGNGSLMELIQTLDRGLVVDQVLGSGAGLSGEFSINVDLGYWVEGGQIAGRVKDTMVAGNVYTALKRVVAIAGDTAWQGSSWTPSLIVEGLSLTSSLP